MPYVKCPHCDEETFSGNAFCNDCGESLSESPQDVSAAWAREREALTHQSTPTPSANIPQDALETAHEMAGRHASRAMIVVALKKRGFDKDTATQAADNALGKKDQVGRMAGIGQIAAGLVIFSFGFIGLLGFFNTGIEMGRRRLMFVWGAIGAGAVLMIKGAVRCTTGTELLD